MCTLYYTCIHIRTCIYMYMYMQNVHTFIHTILCIHYMYIHKHAMIMYAHKNVVQCVQWSDSGGLPESRVDGHLLWTLINQFQIISLSYMYYYADIKEWTLSPNKA